METERSLCGGKPQGERGGSPGAIKSLEKKKTYRRDKPEDPTSKWDKGEAEGSYGANVTAETGKGSVD